MVVAGHFQSAIQVRLKVLAAQECSTVEVLLGKAIELLFARRREPPMNPLRKGSDDRRRS